MTPDEDDAIDPPATYESVGTVTTVQPYKLTKAELRALRQKRPIGFVHFAIAAAK